MQDLSTISILINLLAVVGAVLTVVKTQYDIRKIRVESKTLEGKLKHEILDSAHEMIEQLRKTVKSWRDLAEAQRIKHAEEVATLKKEIKVLEGLIHKARQIMRSKKMDTGFFYPVAEGDNKK